jgi:hypothetical protein
VSWAVHAPTHPRQRWLARHGAQQTAALAATLRRAASNPGLHRATESYDAAGLLIKDPKGALDQVAVIVLARDGLMAIADTTATPRPPCLVNPLHGRSRRVIRWTRPGIIPNRQIPVCWACAHVETRTRIAGWIQSARYEGPGMTIGARAQDWIGARVLQVPDRDGCWVPHFQVWGIWPRIATFRSLI